MFVRIAGCEMDNVQRIQKMIADDSYAASFQSMGQYRSAILANISQMTREKFSILYEDEYIVTFLYNDSGNTSLLVINKNKFETKINGKDKIGIIFHEDYMSYVERGSFIDEELQKMFNIRIG